MPELERTAVPGVAGAPAEGRRDARKRATRAALLGHAERLFAAQGYQATTIAQIADAAGVTERTFYRYFAAKDDLVAERMIANLPELGRAVVERPAAEPPAEAVRAVLCAVLAAAEAEPDRPSVLRLFDAGAPGLRVRRAGANLLLRLEAELASALARRRGARDPDLTEEVTAAAAVAAVRRALLRHSADPASPGVLPLAEAAFAALAAPPRG